MKWSLCGITRTHSLTSGSRTDLGQLRSALYGPTERRFTECNENAPGVDPGAVHRPSTSRATRTSPVVGTGLRVWLLYRVESYAPRGITVLRSSRHDGRHLPVVLRPPRPEPRGNSPRSGRRRHGCVQRDPGRGRPGTRRSRRTAGPRHCRGDGAATAPAADDFTRCRATRRTTARNSPNSRSTTHGRTSSPRYGPRASAGGTRSLPRRSLRMCASRGSASVGGGKVAVSWQPTELPPYRDNWSSSRRVVLRTPATYTSPARTVDTLIMSDVDDDERLANPAPGTQQIRCAACRAALESPGRDTISFLLVDQLTIPIVGCADHKAEFSEVCQLTSDDTARVLDHRPAGGVQCPGCRHSTHRSQQPVVPVTDGAVAVLGCGTHVGDIVERFRTGLRTRHRLTTSLSSN